MGLPTGARVTRFAALAIGTATLVLAGCGGGSSTSSSSSTSASASATSTTTTSSAAVQDVSQFNVSAVPLLGAYIAAVTRYQTACCRGTNYDAEASAVRAYQTANKTFTDQLAMLTPPGAAAIQFRNYIASIRDDLGRSAKVLTAVLAHNPGAIRVAVQAEGVASVGYATRALNDLLAALGARPSDVVGLWGGRVTQRGPGATKLSYDLTMNVTGVAPGAIAGTTSYPSLKCGGQLQLTSASGVLSVYRERITSGPKGCGSGGTIYATVLGGFMSWRWVVPGITVLGVLGHPQKPGA